jgi:predicted adenine nucleotide alpha hydrolase (AANH) superfamily ATPase
VKVLLHTCCAVCFEAVIDDLEGDGFEVTAFFYNPNVHPYREFGKRLRAAEVAAESRKVGFLAENAYGLQTYLDEILPAGAARCGACYRVRLGRTAREAAARGFGAFTTTLLASSHQDREGVVRAGEDAERGTAVRFVNRDWRQLLPSGIESARRKSLYRQQYCGCIWSEYERFAPRGSGAGE